jgi:F-type H+-transporting ATPase subunit a
MGDAVNEALNPHPVSFFGLSVSPAIYTAIISSSLIILFAIICRIFIIPRFKKNPVGFQLLLETLAQYFEKSATDSLGKSHSNFISSYTFTMAFFIAVGTLIELFGLRPAFASINTCFACGLATFIVVNVSGLRKRKLRYFKRYFPNVMNIISDLAVPLSLSLRLFGSIMSGFIIMELLYSQIFLSFAIPSAVSVITTFFHAILQSFIFATMTVIFTREAIE